MEYQVIILDGVKWFVSPSRGVQALCPKHHLRLSLAYNSSNHCELKCAECRSNYLFPREFVKQKQYVLDKLDSKAFKALKFINLDDEALPIAEVKLGSKDKSDYFVTGLLTKSKVGCGLLYMLERKNLRIKVRFLLNQKLNV